MNKEHSPIILNWMLPAIPTFPSPAMSVLKSQLRLNGFDVSCLLEFSPVACSGTLLGQTDRRF